MTSVRRIVILGAGGHGQVIADCLRCATASARSALFFLDDDPAIQGTERMGISVVGLIGDLASIAHDGVVIGIGNNRIRRRLALELAARGEHFVTAIHPRAVIADSVQIGAGTVIFANVVVNTGSRIGSHVILNTGCTVDHHNAIGDFAHVAPGAHLGGDVTLDEGAFVGIGGIVMPQRTLGAWSVAGAGALVHRNVAPDDVVIGMPATPLRQRAQG